MPRYYLAYGSNLHPVRLKQRLPNAYLLGTTILTHHKLKFHKRGEDGSGKCNIQACSNPENSVLAAIYQLRNEDIITLDLIEGAGYIKNDYEVILNNTKIAAFAYVATNEYIDSTLTPFHWYKTLVYEGARFHGWPEAYLMKIQAHNSIPDPNKARDFEANQLISKLIIT